MRVTVFGGSKPMPGESAYQDALRLGKLLGHEGYTVLTGGYMGTMEAVSRGAAEAGGHVIGVTCDEIEAWRPVAPNHWIMEEMRYPTLRQRLHALIEYCQAAIALPGGIGTLAEIAVMWSQMQTGVIKRCPLVLVGLGWKEMFQTFYVSLGDYVAVTDRQLVSLVVDIDAAFDSLQVQISGC
jgi:uncharacterized protein (TIGR00730 family)